MPPWRLQEIEVFLLQVHPVVSIPSFRRPEVTLPRQPFFLLDVLPQATAVIYEATVDKYVKLKMHKQFQVQLSGIQGAGKFLQQILNKEFIKPMCPRSLICDKQPL